MPANDSVPPGTPSRLREFGVDPLAIRAALAVGEPWPSAVKESPMLARHSSPAHEEQCSSSLRSPSSIHFAHAIATAAILATLAFAACAPAQPSDPASILRASMDRINDGDVDGYMEFVAEDAIFIPLTGGIVAGAQAIREFLLDAGYASCSNCIEISDVNADGRKVTFTKRYVLGEALLEEDTDNFEIITDGKILFDGTETWRRYYCDQDPSRPFCAYE